MSDVNQSEAWEADNRVITFCPECRVYPGNIIDEFSSGDTVCADCGLVLGERIVDTRSEWRTFANDEKTGADPCRVGDAANPLLNGAQLETQIEVQGGNKLSELHRAHRRASEATNSRQLLSAYAEIGAYCDSIQITQHVCTTAKVLYKLVEDNKALRKKPRAGIIAGCIFIACRQCAVPRTFTEIFALTKVPKMEIGRIFKLLEKFFSTYSASKTAAMAKPGKEVATSHEYATTTATTAESLMIRFCNNLGLGQKATLIAEDLAKRVANDDILAGRSTLTCTGAIVYMVSHLVGNGKRIRDIAAVLGVSDSTVRKAYKTLYHYRCSMVDQKWLESYGGDMSRLPSL